MTVLEQIQLSPQSTIEELFLQIVEKKPIPEGIDFVFENI